MAPGVVLTVLGGIPRRSQIPRKFSPEEWARAQAKLIEAEQRTGLTFLQRAET